MPRTGRSPVHSWPAISPHGTNSADWVARLASPIAILGLMIAELQKLDLALFLYCVSRGSRQRSCCLIRKFQIRLARPLHSVTLLHGFSTPSPPAQGGQRLFHTFDIGPDIHGKLCYIHLLQSQEVSIHSSPE